MPLEGLKLLPQLLMMDPVPGLDSPSPYDEPECLQVAVVGGPQGRCHPILVRRVQLLPCGLLQHGQVAVPGRPVVPVVHGGAPLTHSGFGSIGGSGGVCPSPKIRQLSDPGERGVRTQRCLERDGADGMVTRRRAVGGLDVQEGMGLRGQGTPL